MLITGRRGVLNAALNPATFKLRNKVNDLYHTYVIIASLSKPISFTVTQLHNIPGDKLLQSYFKDVDQDYGMDGLANRNSLPYAGFYSLGSVENMETVLRGTLRCEGKQPG